MNTPPLPGSRGPGLLSVLLAWFVAILAAAGVAFAWLWPDFGDSGRLIEALNWLAFCGRTFGYHISLGLALVVLLMMLRRLWRPALVVCVVALWCVLPLLWSLRPRGEAPAVGAPMLSVYSVNAQVGRVDPVRLLAEIERVDADIVVIQEHNSRVRTIVPGLRERYPHFVDAWREDAFGMAVLSKHAFVGTPQPYPDLGVPLTEPQIRVVVEIDGREVVVQGVHTLPPVSFSYLRSQRQLIRALAAWAEEERRPLIIAGDFNCTPESMGMGWMHSAGLEDAWTQRNAGLGATWPVDAGLFSLMGVKIDHVLLGNGLVATHAELGEPTGSDHRAIFARVAAEPSQ
jgi:endonuclease/exonuclease/phosphatase (EEP) superfamily protein YafD